MIKNIPGFVCSPIDVQSLDWEFTDVNTINWSTSFFMLDRKLRENLLKSYEFGLPEQIQFLILMFSVSSTF